MPYDPTSPRGALRGDQAALRSDQQRIAQDSGRAPVSHVRRGADGDAFLRNETRIDLNKPMREFDMDHEPNERLLQPRPPRAPGWGMRLFGYAFAWLCGIFFLGVVAITLAWAADKYYDHLFIK